MERNLCYQVNFKKVTQFLKNTVRLPHDTHDSSVISWDKEQSVVITSTTRSTKWYTSREAELIVELVEKSMAKIGAG